MKVNYRKGSSAAERTTKRMKDTKDLEIITFQFSYFVLFATFVVKCSVRFWLRSLPR